MDDAVNSSHTFWNTQPPPRGGLPISDSAQSSHSRCGELDDEGSPGDQQSNQPPDEFSLGLSSFNESERHRFGQSIRLSMALIEGKANSTPSTSQSVPDHSVPNETHSIRERLRSLSQDISACQAEQLELLVRFDELKGWQSSGAKHCAAWMNLELGISLQTSWEYLRAGRQLKDLPTTTALFRAGQLSWSKIRLITRVADKDNESVLCHAALDASVSRLEQLCHEYRWQNTDDDRQGENERALQQWDARSLRWDKCRNGNVRISLSVPPEMAQAFLNSVEYSLGHIESSELSMAQRRADAAVLMAENNLQSAGREIATADRYQVIVSVDAAELSHAESGVTESGTEASNHDATPSKRATVLGAASGTSPLAKDTTRRLACDCSVSAVVNAKGEPVDIGKKTRIWPVAMARAIKARDKTCVYPGCTQSHHLQIHHLIHWADGGSTSVNNGASLCSHHHTLLHEGGYRMERVADNDQWIEEQFKQQTVVNSANATATEQQLRTNRDSFNAVRRMSPERFRFRLVDRDGREVFHQNDSLCNDSPCGEYPNTAINDSGIAEPLMMYNAVARQAMQHTNGLMVETGV